MTPDKLLTWFGAAAGRDGYSTPMLDSPQAYHVAEVALEKLRAATNLTRPIPPEPPAQVAATPAAIDSPTEVLPVYHADRAYAARRGTQ